MGSRQENLHHRSRTGYRLFGTRWASGISRVLRGGDQCVCSARKKRFEYSRAHHLLLERQLRCCRQTGGISLRQRHYWFLTCSHQYLHANEYANSPPTIVGGTSTS